MGSKQQILTVGVDMDLYRAGGYPELRDSNGFLGMNWINVFKSVITTQIGCSSSDLLSCAAVTGRLKIKNPSYIPPLVQSRINIANGKTRFTPLRLSGKPVSAGWKHVEDGHFNRPLANSRSIFTQSPEEIKQILQRKDVVSSPVVALQGGQYRRTVNVGEVVGKTTLKDGGVDTTWIDIYTDRAGNLITTYPVKGY